MKLIKKTVCLFLSFFFIFTISQIFSPGLVNASYQEQLQGDTSTLGSYNGSPRSQWVYHFVFNDEVSLKNITLKGKRLVSDSSCRLTARFQTYTSVSIPFNSLPISDSDVLFDFTKDINNSPQNLIIAPGDYYFYIDSAENNGYSGQSDCGGTRVGTYPYDSNYNTSFIYQNSDVSSGYFVWSGSANTVPASNNDLYYVINTDAIKPTCFDGIQNQDETDIDTGGVCGASNSEKDITFFGFNNLTQSISGTVEGVVDENSHTVVLNVPFGINVNSLVPKIKVSDRASVYPYSGVPQDFTNPVIYTVAAQDGTKQDYKVTVVSNLSYVQPVMDSKQIVGMATSQQQMRQDNWNFIAETGIRTITLHLKSEGTSYVKLYASVCCLGISPTSNTVKVTGEGDYTFVFNGYITNHSVGVQYLSILLDMSTHMPVENGGTGNDNFYIYGSSSDTMSGYAQNPYTLPLPSSTEEAKAQCTRNEGYGDCMNWLYDIAIAVNGSFPPKSACFDGVQNQDETGIDIGGVCNSIYNKVTTDPWGVVQSFEIKDPITISNINLPFSVSPEPGYKFSYMQVIIVKSPSLDDNLFHGYGDYPMITSTGYYPPTSSCSSDNSLSVEPNETIQNISLKNKNEITLSSGYYKIIFIPWLASINSISPCGNDIPAVWSYLYSSDVIDGIRMAFLTVGYNYINKLFGDLKFSFNNLVAPSCADGIQNQDETGIDTGGICNTLSSNIMFFPGVLGSRLYESDGSSDKELWVSMNDSRQADLSLNTDGSSTKALYTKNDTQKLDTDGDETGIVDDVYSFNIYQSFINDLKSWKDDKIINDYAFIPYDWRLSLDDIITKGHIDSNGNLSYIGNQEFSESYILKKLEDLQKSSKNGKVTIIAHSNGGLVTKALINKLKETNNPIYDKIEKVIFVGVPQVGTPESVLTILHGTGIGPLNLLMSIPRSRQLAENMTSAYNLLPSDGYFSSVSSTGSDSLITFKDLAGNYNNNIHNAQELKNYILGSDGRLKPEYGDTKNPNIGNSVLYNNADITHQLLDSWVPSSKTKVIQVAGWGKETISGVDYQSYLSNIFTNTKKTSYKPRFVIDGDETVVAPSALWMSDTVSNIERWWVNLKDYNKDNTDRGHKDILEVSNLRNFIKNEIQNNAIDSDGIVLKNQPVYNSNSSRLHFTLHSPLTLGIMDSQGRYTGQDPITKEIKKEIPNVDYGVIGDVQFVSVPTDISYTLKLKGYEQGNFSLDVDKQDGNNIVQSASFQGIPTSSSTVATVDITPTSDASNVKLKVDENGDGVIDYNLDSKLGEVVNIPKYAFSGFLQPINDNTYQAGQSPSVFKAGSTIPVKFKLRDQSGLDTQSTQLPVWSEPQKGGLTTSPVDESIYNDIATTGNMFRWDSVNKQYIYNWSTKGLESGYWYKISTKLDDGYVYSVIIGLK